MNVVNEACFAMEDLVNPELLARLQHKINNKTKPLGSLGRIEQLAVQLGLIFGTESPRLTQAQMLVCAGDHGIVKHGVSAYPSDVTWQMVENFLAGGAAVSVLARQHGIALNVIDCGVNHDFAPRPGLIISKVGFGTADSLQEPAMSEEQCQQAMNHGREIVKSLPGNAVLLGEMGIGNTSAAALLLARLGDLDIADCTGAGTGLDHFAIARKVETLRLVLKRHASATTPFEALACLGGFEIATLVGIVLQAAIDNRVIVVDGFIASSAVLVATRLAPKVQQRCIYAHRSAESGHRLMLDTLQATALLDLGLRLGEGSGAALAWPLLQSACDILCDMASFESAGVARNE
nr:nicotinate-nucleotide--dimethylbenzimidazole phosphoribosyltransferase [uncultured Undibacterium sp.]